MRLPHIPGEWIDRSRPLAFSLEGKDYSGFAGDTVTSALWAAGVRTLGRSFKYHRRRGVLSAANHDINAMMQAGPALNLRADATPLAEGMELSPVNTFGALDSDAGRWLDRLSAFLPVGFYYKAFHSRRLFPLWERLFRKLTGLGRLDFSTTRVRTHKRYDFCDVLVVGAGPSGLAAALAAAEAGAEVAVADENARPGGSGLYQLGGDATSAQPTRDLLKAIARHPRIRLHCGTLAAGYYADHWVPLVDAERMTKMRARSVVVATGAFEQPAVFRNNDLPGVMLASAAQRLIYRHAVRPMQRAVVLAANADGYRAALDLLAQGVEVAAVADLRPGGASGAIARRLASRGVPIHAAHCIEEALPGRDGVAGVRLRSLHGTGHAIRIACDGVLMSVGWAPAANLLYQAGTGMRYDAALEQFVPESLPEGVFACGRVNGVYDPPQKLRDGERAGRAAAAHAGHGTAAPITVAQEPESPSHPWPVVEHPKGKNFVDFDEDLQLRDFANAAQEGFDNIELLKRYTTVGMGPSQGKHSNMNALRILARLTGRSPGEVGTTTARPFVHPVPLSHLAGRGFSPERLTPLHARHAALGAAFMPAGAWQRPAYYAAQGAAREQAIQEEALAVREAAGLIDVGTLGKLEVRGPDAAEFLERVYTGRFAGQPVGTTRYALMCDEAGTIVDDGIVARFAPDRFYFTTSTVNGPLIYRELSRLNTLWRLDCALVNLTGALAAVNLAGPRAREILGGLTALNLSASAFPFLGAREGEVAGVAARLMRVGFVGEWGYEIHVAAEYGGALWDALMAAGAAHGIRPFGVEAQRLLRLEKGHVIVGQDTDGLTTPLEAAMSWALKMDKPFFVGQRSLRILGGRPLKQTLAGFTLPTGFSGAAPKECHLVIEGGEIAGRVTSIAWSPALKRHVGLAMLRADLARPGTALQIRLSDRSLVSATTCATPFYDPDGARQREEAAP